MGASQLWQQWTMPSAGVDPAQQKMMMFMPIMFTFMFLWAPAGLAIYWLVSNVWQIGQQYADELIIGPPAVRTRAAGGRAPREARRRRQDRSGRRAEELSMSDPTQPIVEFLERVVDGARHRRHRVASKRPPTVRG